MMELFLLLPSLPIPAWAQEETTFYSNVIIIARNGYHICIWLIFIPKAAIANYYKLNGKTTGMYCLIVLEATSRNQGVHRVLCSLKALG